MKQNHSDEIEKEIDLLSYFLVVLRYWWIIAPITALGGVAAYFLAQALPPKFEADCRFEIIQNKVSQLSEDVDDKALNAVKSRKYSLLDRHIVLLKSEKLNKSVEKVILNNFPDLRELKLLKKKIFEVEITPVKGAAQSMLDISIVSPDVSASKEYLLKLLGEYAKMRVEENRLTTETTRLALENEEKSIDTKIKKQSDFILDYKIDNNYVFMSTKNEFDKEYISELFSKSNQKKLQLGVLEANIDELELSNMEDSKFSSVIDALMSIQGDQKSEFVFKDVSEWKSRQVILGSYIAEYDILLEKFKPGHPNMEELQKKIDIITKEIQAYRKNIVRLIKSRVETLKVEYKSYIARAIELEKTFANSGVLINEIESLEGRLDQLNELKSNIRSKLILLNENVDDKYITRIIREPFAEENPVFPSIPKFTLAGALLFNLASSFLVIILFYGKSKRYNFAKVINDYQAPILSVIPKFASSLAKKNPQFLNELPKNSVLAESYRSLRLNIEQKSSGKLIMFTSFGPAEGKTTTSLNTALCCAWTDKKILLIDADFRRSTLRKSFPEMPHKGLLDFLKSDDHDIEDYIISKASGKMDYLPAGNNDEYVTELLDGKKMETLLTHLRNTYDLVIFDTAPAVRVVDTVHLAEKTDGTIIVARMGRTYPKDVEATLNRLPKDKVVGIVMNDFKQSDLKFTSQSENNAYGSNAYAYSYNSYSTYKDSY
ncbi:Protein-tyrosine kinase [Lentisphaera araneosa HTCC2155]|uniref:Protein-tyrosine kinase n=1 Tax=Lentisphaera araneosa HTCC2155 TaxID=313628 RepID=A6DSE4_9BACT|nr:polysaccharide biosynthesis tyrosine autokinase [Lentisphaera araneosa]EDM25489.1 Protein-tyrosine kinase [Lentisphaera araneosa HTCC2155]